MVVFHGQLQVALPHPCDGVLRVVAVHDRHVVALHVVQVRGGQHRERGFARSALLGGKGQINRFFFHKH